MAAFEDQPTCGFPAMQTTHLIALGANFAGHDQFGAANYAL